MEDNLQPRIRAVIGLGNPGREYENTRHNLGFEVVDLLAGGSGFAAGSGGYFLSRISVDSYSVVLLKPTTYMNRSGLAVAHFAETFDLGPPEILVVSDDFNLPQGRIRLRQGGSDGGHKGLASIIYHLASDEFPRIRMGIGPVPEGVQAEEYVLEKVAVSQRPPLFEMVKRAADAAMTWIRDGYDVAAGRFNRPIDEN